MDVEFVRSFMNTANYTPVYRSDFPWEALSSVGGPCRGIAESDAGSAPLIGYTEVNFCLVLSVTPTFPKFYHSDQLALPIF